MLKSHIQEHPSDFTGGIWARELLRRLFHFGLQFGVPHQAVDFCGKEVRREVVLFNDDCGAASRV